MRFIRVTPAHAKHQSTSTVRASASRNLHGWRGWEVCRAIARQGLTEGQRDRFLERVNTSRHGAQHGVTPPLSLQSEFLNTLFRQDPLWQSPRTEVLKSTRINSARLSFGNCGRMIADQYADADGHAGGGSEAQNLPTPGAGLSHQFW
jgi:hypothetical protein